MKNDKYYIVRYKVRLTDEWHELREDDVRQAYSIIGSIKRLCSHVELLVRSDAFSIG